MAVPYDTVFYGGDTRLFPEVIIIPKALNGCSVMVLEFQTRYKSVPWRYHCSEVATWLLCSAISAPVVQPSCSEKYHYFKAATWLFRNYIDVLLPLHGCFVTILVFQMRYKAVPLRNHCSKSIMWLFCDVNSVPEALQGCSVKIILFQMQYMAVWYRY